MAVIEILHSQVKTRRDSFSVWIFPRYSHTMAIRAHYGKGQCEPDCIGCQPGPPPRVQFIHHDVMCD